MGVVREGGKPLVFSDPVGPACSAVVVAQSAVSNTTLNTLGVRMMCVSQTFSKKGVLVHIMLK